MASPILSGGESLIGETQRLQTEAAGLVATINAPRAPRSPGSTHTSTRMESKPAPLDLEVEEQGVDEVDVDEEEEEAANDEKKDDQWSVPGMDKTAMDISSSSKKAQAMGKEAARVGVEMGEVAVEKSKEVYDSFFSQDKEEDLPSEFVKDEGLGTSGKPLKKKASFTDDVLLQKDTIDNNRQGLGSGSDRDPLSRSGESRRILTPGMRPVSREDVLNMMIPPFSPGARSGSGASDQARMSRPISREMLMSGGGLRTPGSSGSMRTPGSGGGLRTPGMNKRPPSSSVAVDAVVEQPDEREGDDSSVSSLRDGESVDSTGLNPNGTDNGVEAGDGQDLDHKDDSTVSSLNSTDQALIGDLRRGLQKGLGEHGEELFDAQFNQGADDRASADGQLGEGVTSVAVMNAEDAEVSAVRMPLDLSEFDFATGSYVTAGSSAKKGGELGLAVSPTHEREFTDAMAVRPRTNERPSSTQQKYLDMYARAQTPIPLDNLEGLELEIGLEPQSARSVNSQLTMSSLDTASVLSGIAPMREEMAPRTSIIPFPFQRPPGIPHVDTGIKDEKLKYEAIKKPFLTQSDELHNQVRQKLLRKQARKRAKIAALMEVERRRREKDEILLADFTREQVSAAMDYFRTMCAQLSKESAQRAQGGNNQADDGTVSINNTHSSVDSGDSTVNRNENKRSKKKKSKKGGRTDAVSFKGEGRYAPAGTDEMRLDELEAVLRKYRRAKVNLEEEEHGRGLLLSLEWLLDELDMSPMEWFDMVDSQGGTKTGDRKLTYLELSRGVDMLCDELGNKMTEQERAEAREAREQVRKARRASIIIRRSPIRSGSSSPVGIASPKITSNKNNSERSVLIVNAADANSEMDEVIRTMGAQGYGEGEGPESPSRLRPVLVPHWRRQDLHALLKYLDPNGDGDISVCEMKLAFKNLHLSLKSQRVVDGAGPIITRMVEYMKEKQLTVKDLFTLIDSDRSMTISCDELFRAMNTFFKRQPTEEEEEEARIERMAALAALDLDSSGSLDSGDELSLGGTLGATTLGDSANPSLSISYGTRGWADISVSGASKVSSRFGSSVKTDVSSSWQPRGNLNSRGKHVYLRKSASSVVLRPVKTRKNRRMADNGAGAREGSGAKRNRDSAAGTAESAKNARSGRGGDRTNTASTVRSNSTAAAGSRLNSSETAAKDMLKGGRRAGTIVGGGSTPGLPGLGMMGLGMGAQQSRVEGGGVASALSLLTAQGQTTTSKSTRLANAKLLPRHRSILESYGDLFDRQYDELSMSLPSKRKY